MGLFDHIQRGLNTSMNILCMFEYGKIHACFEQWLSTIKMEIPSENSRNKTKQTVRKMKH